MLSRLWLFWLERGGLRESIRGSVVASLLMALAWNSGLVLGCLRHRLLGRRLMRAFAHLLDAVLCAQVSAIDLMVLRILAQVALIQIFDDLVFLFLSLEIRRLLVAVRIAIVKGTGLLLADEAVRVALMVFGAVFAMVTRLAILRHARTSILTSGL